MRLVLSSLIASRSMSLAAVESGAQRNAHNRQIDYGVELEKSEGTGPRKRLGRLEKLGEDVGDIM